MPEPFSWSAVVIGFWNLAILSPDGIRRRIFELPDPAAVELEMAVDRPGMFRVAHDGMVVVPTPISLEVLPRTPDPASLERACQLCQRALRALPETPVSAAGVNVRYRFAEVPNALLDLFHIRLDEMLADANFRINAATVKKTLALAPGVINMQMAFEAETGTLEFNFHRDGNVPADLSAWLGRVQEFINVSDRLSAIIGVENVRTEINA